MRCCRLGTSLLGEHTSDEAPAVAVLAQAFKSGDVTRRDGSRFFLSQRLLAPAPSATASASTDDVPASPGQRAVARDPSLRQWLRQLVLGLQKGEHAVCCGCVHMIRPNRVRSA